MAEEIATAFEKGQIVTFLGMSEGGKDTDDLQPDQQVRITEIQETHLVVEAVDDTGQVIEYADENGPYSNHEVYLTEVVLNEEETEPVEETAPVEEKKVAPKKSAKKPTQTKAASLKTATPKPSGETAELPAKKTPAKKTPAKKTTAKKPIAKKSTAKEVVKATEEKATEEKTVSAAEASSTDLVLLKTQLNLDITSNRSIDDTVADIHGIESPEEVVDLAKAFHGRMKDQFWISGAILTQLEDDKAYEALGYSGNESFARFCDEELGMSYRTAKQWMKIYSKFSDLGFTHADIAGIEWSKLAQAQIYINAENANDVLDLCEAMTVRDLTAELKRIYGAGVSLQPETVIESEENVNENPPQTINTTTLKITLLGNQKDIIDRALNTANDMVEEEMSAGDGFSHICAEWLMTTADGNVDYNSAIQAIETRFNVKLQIVEGTVESEPEQQEIEQ